MHLEEEENYKKGPFKVPALSFYAALVSISVSCVLEPERFQRGVEKAV